jgi:hypothetical protein
MAAGTKKGRSVDRERISLTQDHEVRSWSKHFGISEERLRSAVAKVGNLAYDVQAYLLSGREREDTKAS